MTNPQRVHETRFAWGPFIESAYGTALADAKFTHATWLTDFTPPNPQKEFRSNARAAWVGTEFPTTRTAYRQRIAYPLNFELSAQLAAELFGMVMGKVSTAQADAGPPAAYNHTFTLADPLVDGLLLPSTGHWFKLTPDVFCKSKGATCSRAGISYARGNRICALTSDWLGNGDFVDATLAAVPSLDDDDALGPLFEGDLAVSFGAAGAGADVSDRVTAVSIEILNGSDNDDWAYGPGSGLYRGWNYMGTRIVRVAVGLSAEDTDDIRTKWDADTECELELTWTGATIVNAEKFRVVVTVPALKFGAATIGERSPFVVWNIESGDDGVFDNEVDEVITVLVENKEATYLTT